MDTVGDRIKQRLSTLGLSFEQAAERIGVSWQSVQQWSKNTTTPRREKEQKIADALECSRDWLFYPTRANVDAISLSRNGFSVQEPGQSDYVKVWPFKRVAYERYLALNDKDKAFVESVLSDAIARCENGGSSKRKASAAS